jgi:UDP-N-acetylmuramate dehydrogenase
MDAKLVRRIREHTTGTVRLNEPLSRHTTYRVGGAAEALVCPADAEDAARMHAFMRRERIPFLVIGAGSNVIPPDAGVGGVVVKMESASARIIFVGEKRVRADAGVPLLDLVRAAASRGLTGLEPLAGIPGTVGGAIVMNAGTRDLETANRLGRVDVITSSGRRRVLAASECAFGYRRSVFLGTDWFVLGAEFKLDRGDAGRSAETIAAFLKDRETKYPLDLPSAGSVFKRPPGDYAGRLIEAAGCKGMRVGDAAVSEQHANFIVNRGAARASDILELISRVRKAVFEASGVYLELEQIPLRGTVSGE